MNFQKTGMLHGEGTVTERKGRGHNYTEGRDSGKAPLPLARSEGRGEGRCHTCRISGLVCLPQSAEEWWVHVFLCLAGRPPAPKSENGWRYDKARRLSAVSFLSMFLWRLYINHSRLLF